MRFCLTFKKNNKCSGLLQEGPFSPGTILNDSWITMDWVSHFVLGEQKAEPGELALVEAGYQEANYS